MKNKNVHPAHNETAIIPKTVIFKAYTYSISPIGKSQNNNLLLTEREGRTGEYWPEVVTVRTEHREVRTKTTEGQYSPVRLEQARLVSSLLYGTRLMLRILLSNALPVS